MLRVAQIMLEVDRRFAKGEETDDVKAGYIDVLVHAIAHQDKLLEVEILKSLGDVSLQDGKRRKSAEDVNNAIRLYSAALQRCGDKGVRETLEHRLQFAKKHHTLLPNQKGPEPSNKNGHISVKKVSTSQVSSESHDQQVLGSAILTGLNMTRKRYANALVSAIMSNNTQLEVDALKIIGDTCMVESNVTNNWIYLEYATHIYRGTLNRCEDTDGREALLNRIGYTEGIIDYVLKKQRTESDMSISSETTIESTKTEPSTSTVAEGIRELDLNAENASGLDVAEKSHASMLVYAKRRGIQKLEREALKSLGDVYLQKAKMNDHKQENFHKACALYEELIRCSTNDKEKSIMERRIKFAEKCTKIVHDRERRQLEIKDPTNPTLAVFLTLHEVAETTKLKGQDGMTLIEGYTNSFVTAVVDRNKDLEIESLKSLGDLYLEKGKTEKDDATLAKAAGLYRAALERCEDTDGRETLEHRIEYAGKIKRKEKRQEPAKPGNYSSTSPGTSQQWVHHVTRQSSKNGEGVANEADSDQFTSVNDNVNVNRTEEATDSVYQEHLQEGCRALQTGALDKSEEMLAAALKSVHVAGQHEKEAEPLCKLSDVYLQRGIQSKDGEDFTKAAALCNAALVRSRAEDLNGKLKQVTQSFATLVLDTEQTNDIDHVEKHKLILKKNREYVEEEFKRIDQEFDPYSLADDDPMMREVEKKRAEAVKSLFETIVHQRRKFIAGLVAECLEVMGPPPCKYAMIGLGSQATGLATPYSDLEFAILIEKETEYNVEYFRNLTHYLHVKVINLGETIIPVLGIQSLNDPQDNWFYDSVTPRGFAFDGAMPNACKTPLGRGKTCELIRSPRNMTQLLMENIMSDLGKGYHLASVLGNVSFITGERGLVDEYTALWYRYFQETFVSSLTTHITIAENASMFETQAPTAKLLNVKKEIYRFSSLAVSCWALLCGIQPTTIWETITKMQTDRVIDSENAHHLMVLVTISAELRLRTYMNNRGQVENMSAISTMSTETNIAENPKLKEVFYFAKTEQLMRYYYTALPLKDFVSQLFKMGSGQPPALFDNSLSVKTEIYKNMCDYTSFKTCAERTVQNIISEYGEGVAHPDIVRSLYNLGSACKYLGDYRKAINYFEQSHQMLLKIYGEDTVHPTVAACLNSIGVVWRQLGEYKKSLIYHEKSLQMGRRYHGESTAHNDIAMYLENLGGVYLELGDSMKAIYYYQESLERRIYGESSTSPKIASATANLGLAYHSLGEYKEAIDYHEQSLQMRWSIYGENTAHLDIAESLENLGLEYNSLGNHKKALNYHEWSLQMKRGIYGENTAHPSVALSLCHLGDAWRGLGNLTKSTCCHEQSLQMARIVYGESTAHPYIVASLSKLGMIYMKLGDYRKAISCYEQTLQMKWSIYGKGTAHSDIDWYLISLGSAWRCLGDYRKAVSYCEQSLHMRKTIHGENTAHPDIALSLYRLGVAWVSVGDHKKAISYYEQSLEMKQRIYGKNTAHSDVAKSFTSLGNAWCEFGDHRKSISYHEQALQMNWRIYGEDTAHSDIAQALSYLGDAWRRLGDLRKAASYYEQSLQMRRRIYGKEKAHIEIAQSLNDLSNVWWYLGDHRQAVGYTEQLLRMLLCIYGQGTVKYSAMRESLNNLDNTWRNLDDHIKAARSGH